MAKKKSRKRKAVGPSESLPGSLRELAQQVFAKRDPVAVGCDLLGAESESVKARAFADLAGWAYGKPEGNGGTGGSGAAPAVRVIWDFRRPPREPQNDE